MGFPPVKVLRLGATIKCFPSRTGCFLLLKCEYTVLVSMSFFHCKDYSPLTRIWFVEVISGARGNLCAMGKPSASHLAAPVPGPAQQPVWPVPSASGPRGLGGEGGPGGGGGRSGPGALAVAL